jgi:antitoxin (DNA-binding transcriptional repressor) of toxin-antitoxin stability system
VKVYTYSEARQNLASLLEEARRGGSVQIRRRDGQIFELRPAAKSLKGKSPLDVPGVQLGLSRREILSFIHEGRRSA